MRKEIKGLILSVLGFLCLDFAFPSLNLWRNILVYFSFAAFYYAFKFLSNE